MPRPGLLIGTTRRAAGSAGQSRSPIVPDRPGIAPERGPGPPRLSHATTASTRGPGAPPGAGAGAAGFAPRAGGAAPGVPLRDVGAPGRAVGVTGEAGAARVEQRPERVVTAGPAGRDPPRLLGRVARAARATRH